MLSRFARLPLRRCLHSASRTAHTTPSFSRSNRLLLGASAAAAGAAYLAWTIPSEKNKLHLDSLDRAPASPTPSPPPNSQTHPPEEPSKIWAPETERLGEESGEKSGDGEGEAQPAQSQGAYNPETGEINWDCPCLGGMAHGPCGEQFKEAFSCFIFSEDEPKGINCVDAFKKMQDCFREHPEIYADEIMKDDDEEPSASPSPEVARNVEEEHVAGTPTLATEAHAEHRTQVPSSTPLQ